MMESCLTDRISKRRDKEDAGQFEAAECICGCLNKQRKPGAFPKKTYTKWFDYDIIKSTVKIRHKAAW